MILLHMASLAIGLAAWGIGWASIFRPRKSRTMTVLSFSCCLIPLALETFVMFHMVRTYGPSSLRDFLHPLAKVSAVLVIVTAALNTAALLRSRKGGRHA